MLLTQVCNVGSITGGTAACAWSVTRALPDWQHDVVFLDAITNETCRTFEPVPVRSLKRVCSTDVRQADVVLLHNTHPSHCEKLPVPTVGYRHSRCRMAATDRSLDCSHWLNERNKQRPVLWQGVPRPRQPETLTDDRALRDELRIGRLCTPRDTKWPADTPSLFDDLARAVPSARFEFVGCPSSMQPRLQQATRGRCCFVPASWQARERLVDWDLLVYSNRQLAESFGRTVAEAMRAGCVPVVDNQGGFVEQLRNGGGFLCGHTSDFVAAVRQMSDPFERRTISRQAVAKGEECFSLAAFRDRLLPQLTFS